MNVKQLTSILVLSLCFHIIAIGQDQIRIMDSDEESVGRFRTQLYQLENGNLSKLNGNAPTVEASGKQVELVLKLSDLRWFDEQSESNNIKIRRSNIEVSDPKAVQIASTPSEFNLDAALNSEVDIKFRVLKNGEFSMKVPFTIGKISGQYVQIFEVEGLSNSSSVESPVGAIADLKKEWRSVDKKSLKEVQQFIDKYEDNEIAIEERLIAVADRTRLRIQKSLIEEEETWQEVSSTNDQEDLQDFLDKYPDSKYAEAAKARLGMDANILIGSKSEDRNLNNTLEKSIDNIYNFDLSHLGKVELKLSHPDEIEVFDNGGNLYDLKVKGSKKYKITAVELSTSDKFDFELDNRFEAQMEQEGNDLVFTIKGGVSPYTVEFYKDREETSQLEARFEGLKVGPVSEIPITNQMLRSSGMNGNYNKVTVRDFTTQAVSSFPLDINVSPERISSKVIIGLLLGGLILGGAFMFFYNKKKRETREAYKEKAKVFQQTQKLQQVAAASMVEDPEPEKIQKTEGPRKITITKPSRKFVPANGGNTFVSSGRMKITKRDVKGGRLSGEEFRKILSDGKYAFLDLNELWPDSAIKELYLRKECIRELGKFLKEENLDKVVAEMEGAIPEVGGFLMGYHQMNESGYIRVTMDEFVPFVPEYHDVFKIEIGTATLVQELGDAQDRHPDKDVIGWFHTHPGHGLFLSNSDLSVQRHFPLKYQIAMEIDSLTDTLDTAFFTRKLDGTINNVEHRKKGASWFSWKKIEKI